MTALEIQKNKETALLLETEAELRKVFPGDEPLLRLIDVAAWLHLRADTLRRSPNVDLPVKHIGKNYFVTRKGLARWLVKEELCL